MFHPQTKIANQWPSNTHQKRGRGVLFGPAPYNPTPLAAATYAKTLNSNASLIRLLFLVLSLAVVIIGGLGSLLGTLVGGLLVGMLATFGQILFPELAYFVIFGPMALLLAFRPWGLFGRPV